MKAHTIWRGFWQEREVRIQRKSKKICFVERWNNRTFTWDSVSVKVSEDIFKKAFLLSHIKMCAVQGRLYDFIHSAELV